MPAFANMTLKADNGTTDVVYTGLAPSSGDGVPAIWRAQAIGSTINQNPEFRAWAKRSRINGEEARTVYGTFGYPQLVTDTSRGNLVSVLRRPLLKLECTAQTELDKLILNEFVSQGMNGFSHALFRAMMKEQFAAS